MMPMRTTEYRHLPAGTTGARLSQVVPKFGGVRYDVQTAPTDSLRRMCVFNPRTVNGFAECDAGTGSSPEIREFRTAVLIRTITTFHRVLVLLQTVQ